MIPELRSGIICKIEKLTVLHEEQMQVRPKCDASTFDSFENYILMKCEEKYNKQTVC